MKGDADLQNKERTNIKYIVNFNYSTKTQKTNPKVTSGARILQYYAHLGTIHKLCWHIFSPCLN